jgi:transposase-like protein
LTSIQTEPTTIHVLETAFGTPGAWELRRESFTIEVAPSRADLRWLEDRSELEKRCRSYLEDLRWPDGVECPRCGSGETGRIPSRRKFYCRSCRYHFSVTAGTVFHNSHLPLWKWFLAISVMLDSDAGMPSNQLVQLIGGSYKTAWFVQHRVRAAIEEGLVSCEEGGFECADDRARCAREVAAERLLEQGERPERLFDRPLVGPYHQIGAKYVGGYLAEMEWRSRCRRNPCAFRDTVARLLECDPVAWTDLVARPAVPPLRISAAHPAADGEASRGGRAAVAG